VTTQRTFERDKRKFAMLLATIDQNSKLNTPWASEVNQLIKCSADGSSGVQDVVN
jgi:hypothetical protein